MHNIVCPHHHFGISILIVKKYNLIDIKVTFFWSVGVLYQVITGWRRIGATQRDIEM